MHQVYIPYFGYLILRNNQDIELTEKLWELKVIHLILILYYFF